jgi:phosphoribosyl-ATP pyrophosphohydrolase/phosphoribosyl-AMP cyclohydrolase
MSLELLKYDKDGLIPAIIQDARSGEVLMAAYMNKESLQRSIETGKTHFWSRSRQKLWMKGESSGHYQYIKEMRIDCDSDTLLFKVDQVKAACHTGYKSCFHRIAADLSQSFEIKEDKVFDAEQVYRQKSAVLQEVYDVVKDRLANPKEGSYTNYLFEKGLDKILKKVGEESAEVIIASKNRAANEVIYETADLLYHLMVLLVEQKIPLDDIYDELKKRR